VNDVLGSLRSKSQEEVVRLDVPMDKVVIVEELNPLEELVRDHQHRLQTEMPLALGEEVLEALAQQVHHHCVVVALNPKPVHSWDAH
jgi:hypothetical protein